MNCKITIKIEENKVEDVKEEGKDGISSPKGFLSSLNKFS